MGLHVGDSVSGNIPLDSTNKTWANVRGAVVKAVGKDWVDIGKDRWHVDRLKETHALEVTCPHDK